MMKHCETTRNELLLAMDGKNLSAAAAAHAADCPDCQAFQRLLPLALREEAVPVTEPPPAVDQVILFHARAASKKVSARPLRLPVIIRYALAASLVALFSLAVRQVLKQDAPTGPGEQFAVDMTTPGLTAWRDEELTTALGDMVATADSADHVEDEQVSRLFADESTEAVADMIESQLADIQADLYVALLAFE
ncbi:MAG: hypothetical protein RRC34_00820 [Lentisphaeria bacterium]|nr:hypothetical protein [Lentisphaeria bacterium]